VTTTIDRTALVEFLVRHGDDNVIVGQRLGEYISFAPELEEDLAVANIALDHLGVAMHLYDYAAELEDSGRDSDWYAMFRSEREFTNALLVEQPQPDFAHLIARGFFFDAYQTRLWAGLSSSRDERLSGIAARALKEATYHLRHSRSWVVRLGDGTDESHARMQAGIDAMWRFTKELFDQPDADAALVVAGVIGDVSAGEGRFDEVIASTLEEATLVSPEDPYQASGGRTGRHGESLGPLLAEMQWMQRSHPGASW
jgi:ring-1,2-phenylacetyl-CoA epoxidase subunit PaaC